MRNPGLYIHIPFCKSRCIYCDFYSTTCGSEMRQAYVETLCREMELRRDYLNGDTLASVYMGGGTPSVLAPAELSRIFHAITRQWNLAPDAEVTLEANPDDITPAYAEALVSLPVNRVSMGVQTFSDGQLRFLRRRHTAAQAINAIDTLIAAGIGNISIDLIYGLPGQTLEQWRQDVGKALALPVSHLSAYALTYEDGTHLHRLRGQGKVQEADEELSLGMYTTLMEQTEKAGFLHYEISNFARPGREARHNSGYWSGMHYLGLGPAAHSYNGNSRQWNSPDLQAYIKAAGDVFAANLFSREELSPKMREEETLLTRLRTAGGLDLAAFARDSGQHARDTLLTRAVPYIDNGTLALCDTAPASFPVEPSSAPQEDFHPQILSLTRKGLFVSDNIISSLFED